MIQFFVAEKHFPCESLHKHILHLYINGFSGLNWKHRFLENEIQAYAIKKLNSWTIMDQ